MSSLPDNLATPVRPEILYQNERTRVTRRNLPGIGSIVCKELIGADAAKRLRHESRILERLKDVEGIVHLAPVSQIPGALMLQDCAGVSLGQMLSAGRMELERVLDCARQLAGTITALHRCGVIHKDINPNNIVLVGSASRPVLLDFDLASTFVQEQQAAVTDRDITGTLAYLAPEQTGRTGRVVDHRADLYSFGATLYEMATGRRCFTQDDPLLLIHDHLARVPTPPMELDSRLPQLLSNLILRLLEKEPDRRYQSAEGLLHDLTRLQTALAHGKSTDAIILGEHDFPLRLSAPSRPVGREKEIKVLPNAFESALHGKTRCVLVAGAPGVGKTTLINELRPIVAARQGWFVSGKFDQYRQDPEANAFLQALHAIGRVLLAEPEAELAGLRARINSEVGLNVGLIAGLLPEFALLLKATPEAVTEETQQAERRLLQGGLDLLRAVASPTQPLVIVVDDLQWAPPAAIAFIDVVLSEQSLNGFLLVATYRDTDVDQTHPVSLLRSRWQQPETPLRFLQLQNLSPADLSALLERMLGLSAAQATALAELVQARTGGNPYDAIELVNALRNDGVLTLSENGWSWNADAIRRYIGSGDVVDLLTARLERLPVQTTELLEVMACIGGEVDLRRLQAASGLSIDELEEQMIPALEDGLLAMEKHDSAYTTSVVRFRHDRVRHTTYARLSSERRLALHLTLARRLSEGNELESLAAEQYLQVMDAVRSPDERCRAARLFSVTASQLVGVVNFEAADRFLVAAQTLLCPIETQVDAGVLFALETDRHNVLYSLGRLDEADMIYQSLARRSQDPHTLTPAACVQLLSLHARSRLQEAMSLGLDLLRRLGLPAPQHEQEIAAQIECGLDQLYQWLAIRAPLESDSRNESSTVQTLANLIAALFPVAYMAAPALFHWLALQSLRLWIEQGPCASLMRSMCTLSTLPIVKRNDYLCGYQTARRLLAINEARGYSEALLRARATFAVSSVHWCEPLEEAVRQIHLAREGLVRCADLQFVGFSYTVALIAMFDVTPTLDTCGAEIDAAHAFATHNDDRHLLTSLLDYQHSLRVLRGDVSLTSHYFAAGSSEDLAHTTLMATNPVLGALFHTQNAVLAAIFNDAPSLSQHTAAAMSMLFGMQTFYSSALAHALHAFALTQRLQSASMDELSALTEQFDQYREWLADRAKDAPHNFLHLLRWVDAERAWATQDFPRAVRLFDAALREVAQRQRPWHHALITERAALFYLAHSINRFGQALLAEATDLYAAWGATSKVRALRREYPFLAPQGSSLTTRNLNRTCAVSSDEIDLLGILRASQALSSETSLERLKIRVIELLGAMTGATSVFLVLRNESSEWTVSTQETLLSVQEAGDRGLLPLSIFRYVERTLEALLIEDVVRDNRFARDAYWVGVERCSMLAVPILKQGAPQAVLLLENRLSRGAFSTDRLAAVMQIAGQLAVSLDNALLYASLERKVAERTVELEKTHKRLVEASRQTGMAEIATNVLHNVGNVLNSVNVSATLVADGLARSKLPRLSQAVSMIREHEQTLGEFLTRDPRGKHIPAYLTEVSEHLQVNQQESLAELKRLRQNIEHIKEIVAMQQAYARGAQFEEDVSLIELVDDSLRMSLDAVRHEIKVLRQLEPLPPLKLDKHKVLQILMNLLSNARYACVESGHPDPQVTVRLTSTPDRVGISITDNGVGIVAENLTRIFQRGFTTRASGHGFGLHGSALAAKEMGGSLQVHSEGPGRGATFTLELPRV